jgi:hypothetical protein
MRCHCGPVNKTECLPSEIGTSKWLTAPAKKFNIVTGRIILSGTKTSRPKKGAKKIPLTMISNQKCQDQDAFRSDVASKQHFDADEHQQDKNPHPRKQQITQIRHGLLLSRSPHTRRCRFNRRVSLVMSKPAWIHRISKRRTRLLRTRGKARRSNVFLYKRLLSNSL